MLLQSTEWLQKIQAETPARVIVIRLLRVLTFSCIRLKCYLAAKEATQRHAREGKVYGLDGIQCVSKVDRMFNQIQQISFL